MFLQIIFGHLLGYLRVSLEGYYIERVINICRNKKIVIWNLKRDKSIKLEMNIRINDFKDVVKIARKTKCKIKIEKKRGIPFLINKYKKRKIFFLTLTLIVIGLFVLSNFIWNIEIIEEKGENLEGLYQDIEEAGLRIGGLKKKIETRTIINQVRLKREDIAWMGIEFKGTNAIIRVVKSKEKPEIIDDNEYCNIVSDKVGVITKINAQNGTIVANVGDTINIGTVLINGWMEGKYTGIRYVHASGNIEAKIWHSRSEFIPYILTETRKTGNNENKYKIKINNFEINLAKRVSKFKIYDTIDTEKKIKIFSNFYLPISFIKTTNQELVQEQKKYSAEEIKNIGIERLQEELDNEIDDKTKIVNKIINTYEKQDGIEVSVTYEVIENVGTKEKIVFQEE